MKGSSEKASRPYSSICWLGRLCLLSAVLVACSENAEEEHRHHSDHHAHQAQEADTTHVVENEQGLIASGAYVRQPAPRQPVVAAFVVLKNSSDNTYTLRQVSSPRAASAEIHQSSHVDGTMVMRPVEKIEILPGAEVSLEPGGYHLMLSGIKGEFNTGDQIPLIFDFGDEVTLEVPAEVRPIK